MLNTIALILTDNLLDKVDDYKYDKEVYVYGIELITSTLIGMISIITLSAFCKNVLSAFVFISFFVPLRLFVGGYHANTYRKCYFVTMLSYSVLLFLQQILWSIVPVRFWLYVCFAMYYYIGKNAPQINKCQEISEYKRERSKMIARIIIVVEWLMVIYLSFHSQKLLCMAVLSNCLVVVFMLLTSNTYKKGE